jgi:CubicO group peptidase (beta-lactamase class C family)
MVRGWGTLPRVRIAARIAALALVVALALGARWVWRASGVGAGFAAHVACSLHFNSGQDPQRLLRDYIVHEVAPLGPALSLDVAERAVEARVLGMTRARAVHRPELGCTLLAGVDESELALPQGFSEPRPALDPSVPWPLGGADPGAPPAAAVAAALERAFVEAPDAAPGRVRATTAVVVAHDGELVAERYAPGYAPATPMLSWSMGKSVTAALVAVAVAEGRVDPRAPAPVPEWSVPADPRHGITLDQLLRMSSGLAFEEIYSTLNDVSIMLFERADTGAYAAARPLAAPPDAVWSYSSGTTNLVARLLRDAFGRDLAALVRWSRAGLFDPAGMTSAFLEPDASGSFIGSSFAFMTARDWARFGELHRRDGEWFGRRILPPGWVRYVTTPTPRAPDGRYGAHWWLNAGDPRDAARRPWPALPTDTYAATGHNGQYVFVVPSAKLVVVRLGLSLPDHGRDDGAVELVADLIRHYGEAQSD